MFFNSTKIILKIGGSRWRLCLIPKIYAWEVIEKGYTMPEDESNLSVTQMKYLNDVRRKDKKALTLIYQAIDEKTFEKISCASTAKEAWELLEHSYTMVDKVRKMSVFNSLRIIWKYFAFKRVYINFWSEFIMKAYRQFWFCAQWLRWWNRYWHC